MLPGVCLLLMSPSHTAHSEPALLPCPIAQRFVLLFVLRDKDKHENDTLFLCRRKSPGKMERKVFYSSDFCSAFRCSTRMDGMVCSTGSTVRTIFVFNFLSLQRSFPIPLPIYQLVILPVALVAYHSTSTLLPGYVSRSPRWPGIGQFREFEPRRVHTRINSLGLFLVVHKLTCGKRESVS